MPCSVRSSSVLLVASLLPVLALAQPVSLSWLDKSPPPSKQGVAWGVPWAKGKIQKGTTFSLTAGGQPVPVQSWPLAYWPDGSLMWTGHAISAAPGIAGALELAPRPTRRRCQDHLGCLHRRNRYRYHTPVGKYPFGYQRVTHRIEA